VTPRQLPHARRVVAKAARVLRKCAPVGCPVQVRWQRTCPGLPFRMGQCEGWFDRRTGRPRSARITIYWAPAEGIQHVLDSLLHEWAHVPHGSPTARTDDHWHGPRFYRRLGEVNRAFDRAAATRRRR